MCILEVTVNGWMQKSNPLKRFSNPANENDKGFDEQNHSLPIYMVSCTISATIYNRIKM